jgi:hypothetical protein
MAKCDHPWDAVSATPTLAFTVANTLTREHRREHSVI